MTFKKRKTKKKKKNNGQKKLILGFFLFLFLVSLIFIFFYFSRQAIWGAKQRLTLVLESQPVSLITFSPKTKQLTCFIIPDDTQVKVSGGYGYYQAGSLWALGALEEKEGELLKKSFQDFWAVPVDGWLGTDGPSKEWPSDKEAKADFKKFFLNFLRDNFRKKKTNLTAWDLIRLAWKIKTLPSAQIKLIDLNKHRVLRNETLADGTSAKAVDLEAWDQDLAFYFQDEELKKENLAIGVYNGTDWPGLAKTAARLIINSGGRVVELKDWPQPMDQCLVFSPRERGQTAAKLTRLFGCQRVNEPLVGDRVDLGLVIGETYGLQIGR